jgi:hypothetical protein
VLKISGLTELAQVRQAGPGADAAAP